MASGAEATTSGQKTKKNAVKRYTLEAADKKKLFTTEKVIKQCKLFSNLLGTGFILIYLSLII